MRSKPWIDAPARLLADDCRAANTALRIVGEQPLTLVAAAGEDGAPKLPTFDLVVYAGGRMRPRYFEYDVVVDMATAKIAAGSRPVFRDHDPTRIVGHTTEISLDPKKGIRAAGVVSGSGADAAEIVASAKNGFPWRCSLGAEPTELQIVGEGESIEVNGKKWKGPLYVARGVTLYEISLVALPGDPAAAAKIAAGKHAADTNQREGGSIMGFEAWLAANGFDQLALSAEQLATLRATYEASLRDAARPNPSAPAPAPIAAAHGSTDGEDEDDDDPLVTQRAAIVAENRRVREIQRIAAAHPHVTFRAAPTDPEVPLADHAIQAGWTADQTELYALRAARAAPAVHSRSHDRDCTLAALQGAMLLRGRVALDNPRFAAQGAITMHVPDWLRQPLNAEGRQRAMEAAHRYRSLSLVDLCRESLRLDGRTVPADREDAIQASFSGGTLATVFTANVNTQFFAAFVEAPDSTLGWTAEGEVADFKVNTDARLTIGPGLELLARNDEAKHALRSDTAETYQVHRFAKQWAIDEQDVIDDSFNALGDTPVQFGRAAARMRPDLVYAVLLANPTMGDAVALFHASHANVQTSAALAAAKLESGLALIAKQTENSVALNLRGTHVIVPQALRFTAKQLATSIERRDTTSSTDRGTANPLYDENLAIVSEARLDNGLTHPISGTAYSGSATTWYIASADAPPIKVAFLRGRGAMPRIRQFELSQGKFGMGWDVSHDIGVGAIQYRGAQKSTA